MNKELLLLNERQTDTLIQRTKTKPQGKIEFKMNKQMEIFSFSPPITLVEKGEWLLAVTSFTAINSVFIKPNKTSRFSITAPGHWHQFESETVVEELNRLLQLDL